MIFYKVFLSGTSKVGGWVDWKQGPNAGIGSHYPHCPDCKVPMTLPLLQLVHEEKVDMEIIRNI